MGGFTTSSNTNSKVFIRTVRNKDKAEVLDFLHKYFHHDEPLNATLQNVYEDYSMVDNGLGLIAIANGNIVGVCINIIIDRSYLNVSQAFGPDDTAGMLMDYVTEQARIFDKYPNSERALKIVAVATHIDYRKQGIGTQLIHASSITNLRSPCGEVSNIQLKVIGKEDKEKCLEFVRKYFTEDEPLNQTIDDVIMDYSFIDNGLSLMCVSHGNIVGASINGILDRNYLNKSEYMEPDNKIGPLMHYVASQAKIFDHYPDSDKALKAFYIAVHGNYRKYGIGTMLLDACVQIGKSNGCGFITTDCTSYYSMKGCERLGFKRIYSLPYSSYKPNGEVVFKPKAPHDRIYVYTKDI